MGKAGGANLAAVRLARAIGDEIDAELALRRLDTRVDLAGWHPMTFGVQLEVMDQSFHRTLHLGALRRNDLLVIGNVRARAFWRTQLLARLLHDLYGFTHFEHADQITIIAVAVLADGDVEVELLVAL